MRISCLECPLKNPTIWQTPSNSLELSMLIYLISKYLLRVFLGTIIDTGYYFSYVTLFLDLPTRHQCFFFFITYLYFLAFYISVCFILRFFIALYYNYFQVCLSNLSCDCLRSGTVSFCSLCQQSLIQLIFVE